MIFRKINFIIGGVQKSGTELISYYLNRHPNIYIPRREGLYFDKEINDFYYFKYHKKFKLKGLKHFKKKILIGEKSPIYIFYPNSLDRIKNYRKDIKLIFIFRDPIDRAFSQWQMETERKNETLSFFEAIKNEDKRIYKNEKNLRHYSYLKRGNYFSQYLNIEKKFSQKQVLYLAYDDLIENFSNTFNKIQDFLKIKKINYPNYPKRIIWGKKNSLVVSNDEKIFLKNYFKDEMKQFLIKTGIKFKNFTDYY